MTKIATFLVMVSLCLFTNLMAQSISEVQQLISSNKLDEAGGMVETLFKKQPNDLALLTEKARVLVLQGKFAEAGVLANNLLNANANNKVALNVRGIVKRESKRDYVGALSDFNKALVIDPKYIPALTNKAITLHQGKLGKKSEMLNAVSAAIEVNPDNSLLRGIRGNLLNQVGNYKLALMDLEKAAKSNNPLSFLTDRAYAYMNVGLDDAALADVERVLKSDTNNILPPP